MPPVIGHPKQALVICGSEITSLDRSLRCTSFSPIAQKLRDKSGTSTSDLFLQLETKWQQRPETPALIRRIHTSSSHHTPHQCSDSAEEWIRPASNHPLRRRTAPPATQVVCLSVCLYSMEVVSYLTDSKSPGIQLFSNHGSSGP